MRYDKEENIMSFSSFDELVQYLEQEVSWDNHTEEDTRKIENALARVFMNKRILADRIEQINNDKALLDYLVPHIEFRALFDKYPIYIDPNDNFRIRLHHWKSKRLKKGANEENPHSHRFPFSTIILTGAYSESLYKIAHSDEENLKADLNVIGTTCYSPGQIHSIVSTDAIHNVINESEDMECVTLFIRGKSITDYSTIFNREQGTFYKSFSLKTEIANYMDNVSKLIMNDELVAPANKTR
jgi:hypothetical protein